MHPLPESDIEPGSNAIDLEPERGRRGGGEIVDVTLRNDRMLPVVFTHILPMIPPAALCINVFSLSLMLLSPVELPGFKPLRTAPTDAAAFADPPR